MGVDDRSEDLSLKLRASPEHVFIRIGTPRDCSHILGSNRDFIEPKVLRVGKLHADHSCWSVASASAIQAST